MKNVSYLIASHRDYDTCVKPLVDSIESISDGISYEILYYSVFEPQDDRVLWIQEHELNGSLAAQNTLLKFTSGEYIQICTDNAKFGGGMYEAIKFFDSRKLKDRKHKIVTVSSDCHCPIGPPISSHTTMRFPLFHKEVSDNLLQGTIWHPRFNHYFADNYLGYFLVKNDEPGIEIPHLELVSHQKDGDGHSSFRKDRAVFLELVFNTLNIYRFPYLVETIHTNNDMVNDQIEFQDFQINLLQFYNKTLDEFRRLLYEVYRYQDHQGFQGLLTIPNAMIQIIELLYKKRDENGT